MKRNALLKQLRAIAKDGDTVFEFVREGKEHEVWTIGGQRLIIPRHREINEYTAKGILKTAQQEVTSDND